VDVYLGKQAPDDGAHYIPLDIHFATAEGGVSALDFGLASDLEKAARPAG